MTFLLRVLIMIHLFIYFMKNNHTQPAVEYYYKNQPGLSEVNEKLNPSQTNASLSNFSDYDAAIILSGKFSLSTFV